MAEIILAIEYLHSRIVLYERLCPARIALTGEGHVKLLDPELPLVIEDLADMYKAPEVLERKGVSPSTDFWGMVCFNLGELFYMN